MTSPSETMAVAVTADTSAFKREIGECDRLAKSFGASMTQALAQSTTQGQKLGTLMSGLSRRLATMALRQVAKPLAEGIGNYLEEMKLGFQGFGEAPTFETGIMSGLGSPPAAELFAKGGVIGTPTYFPLGAGRMGLAGEAGPEAILPLTRGPDGRLGVAAGGRGRASSVVVNISTPDAGSFRRSEAEVAAVFARAVARGQRGL